ncbi:MAG: hypothetical protein ACK4F8_15080 [Aquabacterium sp.]
MEIGTVQTQFGQIHAEVGRYPKGGAIYVQFYTHAEGYPEPFLTLSTNILPVGGGLGSDELCVKTWSENEPFIEDIFNSGWFEDTGRKVASGFVRAPIWRLKDSKHVPETSTQLKRHQAA